MFGRATITLGIGPHSSLFVGPLFSASICSKRKLEWDFLLAGCLFVAHWTVADHWREFKALTSSSENDWLDLVLADLLTDWSGERHGWNHLSALGHQCPLCIIRSRCSFLPSKVKCHFIWRWATHLLRHSGMARVNEGLRSFTCHPHIYQQVEWIVPAFTPQLQSITALWLVFIFHLAEGRRLSWHEWMITNRGGLAACRRLPIPELTGPGIE